MTDKKQQANTIFTLETDPTRDTAHLELTVEAIKVPGGVLYVTVHHHWRTMNTIFVKSENVIKEPKAGDPEKIWDFLGPKTEEVASEH